MEYNRYRPVSPWLFGKNLLVVGLVFMMPLSLTHADFASDTLPVSEFGVLLGFEVIAELPAGGLREAGVKPGDVVLEVDGQMITSMASAMQVYSQKNVERVVVSRVVKGKRRQVILTKSKTTKEKQERK